MKIKGIKTFCFFFIGLLSCSPVKSTVPEKPNILFIFADDLGKEWISSYGAEEIETPRIDDLARNGLMFENFYAMPQCTPSRVTLFTGQYPFRHGWVNHWDVPRWGGGAHFDPDTNPSFARILQSGGYKNAAAGKWQVNDFRVQPEVLKEHGFDDYCMWTGYEKGNPPSAKRYWDPYRLAETYFLRAEAYLKAGQPDLAANDINEVRSRASAPPVSAGDVDIDYILDERVRELCWEGTFRQLTLRGMGKLVERVKEYNPISGPTIKDHHQLMPIPQSEIERNTEAVLEQNPGY